MIWVSLKRGGFTPNLWPFFVGKFMIEWGFIPNSVAIVHEVNDNKLHVILGRASFCEACHLRENIHRNHLRVDELLFIH